MDRNAQARMGHPSFVNKSVSSWEYAVCNVMLEVNRSGQEATLVRYAG